MPSGGTFPPSTPKRRKLESEPDLTSVSSSHESPSTPLAGPVAEEFIGIPELRQRMLGFLSPLELTSFMRVKREFMYDTAKVLYHTMPYNHVRLRMSQSGSVSLLCVIRWLRSNADDAQARQKMYCDAVHTIDATTMTLSPTVLRELNIENLPASGTARKTHIAKWVSQYRPQLINVLVPQLRAKCSGLQSIHFGSPYKPFGKRSWTVHFRRAMGKRWDMPDEAVTADWHITYAVTRTLDLSLPPPKRFQPSRPRSPSEAFVMRPRFDLMLGASGPTVHADWLTVRGLKGRKPLSDIWRAVNFGKLPVELGLITSLFKRQRSAGHPERLQRVVAEYFAPYNFAAFQIFARVAGTSITHLALADRYDASGVCLSFAQLPDIILLVQSHLPNLSVLRIALSGIAQSERLLKDKLVPELLDSPGSIRTLKIFAEPSYAGGLFNTIRILARLCGKGAELDISNSFKQVWGSTIQSDLLRYLQR